MRSNSLACNFAVAGVAINEELEFYAEGIQTTINGLNEPVYVERNAFRYLMILIELLDMMLIFLRLQLEELLAKQPPQVVLPKMTWYSKVLDARTTLPKDCQAREVSRGVQDR